MSSILVTGAGGFIGSHLVRRLVADGAEVHVLARGARTGERLADVRDALKIWDADLRDAAAVERAVSSAKARVVFHLAGSTDVRFLDPALDGVRESLETNVLGSLELVLALHRAGFTERLVRAGGLEEYGRGPAPYTETQREEPVSAYSASQVAVTHYLQMLEPSLSFEAVTLRLALTFGPGQSERFLIPALIHAALEGRVFRITSGEQRRDYIYVGDVVDALCRAAEVPDLGGEVFNIGTGNAPKVVDVARRIIELCGRGSLELGAAGERSSEIYNLVCDPARARARLGFVAATDLDTGLSRTIEWTRARMSAS